VAFYFIHQINLLNLLFRSELKKSGESFTSLTPSARTDFYGFLFIGPPGFAAHTPTPPLCGIPSGLDDLCAYAHPQ